MFVVVTGAAGFIGRHVVRRLVAGGVEVVGIDRRPWRPAPGESALVRDLTHRDRDVADVLAGAGGVIHLAARAGVRDPSPDIEWLRWRDNVQAGAYVLEAAPLRTTVVVASSSSVYGGAGSPIAPRPCHEDGPLHPRGGYARSKAQLEALCRRRARHGGRVNVARPFTVAGEGQRPDMALARWIAALRAGRPAEVLGSVTRRRDVTDVRHVAEGLVRLLDLPGNHVVNLGTGVPRRLDTLVRTVAVVLGVEPQIVVRSVGAAEPAVTCADTRRCRGLLGLQPVTDLPALVARQVRAGAAPEASDTDLPDAAVAGLARSAVASS